MVVKKKHNFANELGHRRYHFLGEISPYPVGPSSNVPLYSPAGLRTQLRVKLLEVCAAQLQQLGLKWMVGWFKIPSWEFHENFSQLT